VTTAIVKAGVLLLQPHRRSGRGPARRSAGRSTRRCRRRTTRSHRQSSALAEREQAAEEWTRQEPGQFEDQNDATVAVETELIAEEITEQIAQEIVEEIAAECLTETADEVAQAVSVAAAYFEDTLQVPPSAIHAAGTLGAAALTALLKDAHVGPLAVREMLHSEMLGAGASSAGTLGGVPLGWLAEYGGR